MTFQEELENKILEILTEFTTTGAEVIRAFSTQPLSQLSSEASVIKVGTLNRYFSYFKKDYFCKDPAYLLPFDGDLQNQLKEEYLFHKLFTELLVKKELDDHSCYNDGVIISTGKLMKFLEENLSMVKCRELEIMLQNLNKLKGVTDQSTIDMDLTFTPAESEIYMSTRYFSIYHTNPVLTDEIIIEGDGWDTTYDETSEYKLIFDYFVKCLYKLIDIQFVRVLEILPNK